MHIRTRVHTYIHACMHTHTHAHTHTNTHTHTQTHTNTHRLYVIFLEARTLASEECGATVSVAAGVAGAVECFLLL